MRARVERKENYILTCLNKSNAWLVIHVDIIGESKNPFCSLTPSLVIVVVEYRERKVLIEFLNLLETDGQ
jgi:hypothetical protein